MKLKEITSYIESFAPIAYQEDYDNSGLIVGNWDQEINGILITVDVIEDIVEEAIKNKLNLIIAHHPIVFSGLKKITGKNYIERVIIKAIKNDIAIYAAHTNLDSVWGGVNSKIADKIGLKNQRILSPVSSQLLKLAYFVPVDHVEKTRNEVFKAGAGQIGDYDLVSFNIEGKGSFRPGENAQPFVGDLGKMHFEDEIRVEVILPKYLKDKVVNALISAHPYEEVAYDLYPLENKLERVGFGIIGDLDVDEKEIDFLQKIKKIFRAKCIRHTNLLNKPVKKVAVCGGSGSFLLKNAISQGADIFVSGDFKYHQFFDAENRILIADIGHFETEQVTKELFYELLTKKFPKFAIRFTEINSNPINYL